MQAPVDGFIFDLDGTVYLGKAALPGAVEGIARLRLMSKRVLFVSNKPLEPRENYAHKLTGLGIPTAPDDVITSGFVLGYHLSHTEPDLNLYVIGEENLQNELRGHGLKIVNEFLDQDPLEVIEPHGVDAVVVAFDRTLNYRKLNTAYQALLKGARFFATNADKACPMPGGAIPDAGGTIAALEHMTGRTVELLAGKPSSLIMQVALQRLELPAERVMMVGDRLETDIFMGQRTGMQTAVTLTGVAKREDVAKMTSPPTYIVENIGELPGIVGYKP
ncbi:MAG: HAD-IIA family hydrolase [Chloroflexi bacterium]|nr:HAD-IIA family hydrolase [Chloroflexota bacterium]